MLDEHCSPASQSPPLHILRDALILPIYAAGISAAIFVGRVGFHRAPTLWKGPAHLNSFNSADGHTAPRSSSESRKESATTEPLMGRVLNILALIISIVLLGVSVYSARLRPLHREESSSYAELQDWLQPALYLYTTGLAILVVKAGSQVATTASTHLYSILFVTFGVFAYKDLIPLATFTLCPEDDIHDWTIQLRLILLTVVGVLIPVSAPRTFKPINASENAVPTAEQTASILSRALFLFLDATVLKGYRMPHLPVEELPTLADYDTSANLVAMSFSILDPTINAASRKQRHMLWGILWIFKWEFVKLALLFTAEPLLSFSAPFALNNILAFLETGNPDSAVKPWAWILALFLGPFLGSVVLENGAFLGTRLKVRTEAIVTQLVFERALKMRFTEHADGSRESSSLATTPVPMPNDAHEQETTRENAPEEDALEQARENSLSPTATAAPSEKAHDNSNLVGRLINLVSTDLDNLGEAINFVYLFTCLPVQLVIGIGFLYHILGWSAFVGLATMVILFPLPVIPSRFFQIAQAEQMKMTDARVQTVTEVMNGIRMIKLFGWEIRIASQVNAKREEELRLQKKKRLLEGVVMQVSLSIPLLVSITTFATYTLVMKKQLTASVIFASIASFSLIARMLGIVAFILPRILLGKVSLDRINTFLKKTDLLDRFANAEGATGINPQADIVEPNLIGFRNATFGWSTESTAQGAGTPSQQSFQLRIVKDLFFKKGKINLIVGPTGSGKTSLLLALLGEMHFKRNNSDSFFNLPREGGVALCAQEAWIQNASIKDNIVFGAGFDGDRYHKALYQCALEQDLALFDAGDATEVGEKGLTLSGGQKARVALARAVYSSAEIVLLDDILSALDVHTSRWIVDKCLSGDLLRGRTVVLVTHTVDMTAPISDFVVCLGSKGSISSQGSVQDVLQKDPALREAHSREKELLEKEETVNLRDGTHVKRENPTGQLVASEEIAIGRIRWDAFSFFFGGYGGFMFWTGFLGCLSAAVALDAFHVWFLGYWARQYDLPTASDVNAARYLGGYLLIILSSMVFMVTSYIIYVTGTLRATRLTHQHLTEAILGTNLRWLDTTPSGRLIARFTKDIATVDESLPNDFRYLLDYTNQILFKFAAVLIYSPMFMIPGVLLFGLGGWIGRVYMSAQLPVKREMSNARAPLYSHFGACMAGLTSIRAYGVEEAFRMENRKRIDLYSRPARTYWNLNRWICVRIEALGAIFAGGLAAYLVYWRNANASATGFSLAMALGLTRMLLLWVRLFNMFEVEGNSLERIKEYTEIVQEPKSTESGKPPAYWPSSGSIRVEGLTARFSVGGTEVLHGLTFEIKSGERVGVVGRTGAGKSSLSLALLRMIPTGGKVYYDGIDTSALNLDTLRSNITIIPQQPELMSGTLRTNLDPFGEHDDETLNACLRSSGLFSLQEEEDERIGLDTMVAGGGSNFSLGQRQIIAMARAMARRSKVYILDEATASVDYKTDQAIQDAVAREFIDSTLIIVAHRLQTIMVADKILVLDAGKVVEFESPKVLLEKGGAFKALVDGSGDRDVLYGLVKDRH